MDVIAAQNRNECHTDARYRVPGGIRDAHGGPNRNLRVGLGRLIVACCQCHSHRRTWSCRRGEGRRRGARDTGPERVRPCCGTERPAADRRNAVGTGRRGRARHAAAPCRSRERYSSTGHGVAVLVADKHRRRNRDRRIVGGGLTVACPNDDLRRRTGQRRCTEGAQQGVALRCACLELLCLSSGGTQRPGGLGETILIGARGRRIRGAAARSDGEAHLEVLLRATAGIGRLDHQWIRKRLTHDARLAIAGHDRE